VDAVPVAGQALDVVRGAHLLRGTRLALEHIRQPAGLAGGGSLGSGLELHAGLLRGSEPPGRRVRDRMSGGRVRQSNRSAIKHVTEPPRAAFGWTCDG
jgi:hypothetical protein